MQYSKNIRPWLLAPVPQWPGHGLGEPTTHRANTPWTQVGSQFTTIVDSSHLSSPMGPLRAYEVIYRDLNDHTLLDWEPGHYQ